MPRLFNPYEDADTSTTKGPKIFNPYDDDTGAPKPATQSKPAASGYVLDDPPASPTPPKRTGTDTAADIGVSALKNVSSQTSITSTQHQAIIPASSKPQAIHDASTMPAMLTLAGIISVMLIFWFFQRSKKTGSSVQKSYADFDTLAKEAVASKDLDVLRIPIQSGHCSDRKAATVPAGKRPAFRFESGRHSGESGQLLRA